MNRQTGLGILAGLVLALLCGAVVLMLRSEPAPPGGPIPPAADPRATDSPPETADTTGEFAGPVPVLGTVPDFSLTDQNGAAVTLADLRGKAWIANFIFTRCTATCPKQSAELARIHQQLRTEEINDGIRLVSISVDPEFDRPEVLNRYAAGYEADAAHWKFLTGTTEAIWSLSKEGFQLAVSEDPDNAAMPIAHDPRFILVDRLGRIRGYFNSGDPAALRRMRDTMAIVISEFDPAGLPTADYTPAKGMTHVMQPPSLIDLDWLDARRQEQIARAEEIPVFHDFGFHDARVESGIGFFPQIVDEQRSRLQVNHYDHGNGIAAADVDGDGRLDLYFVAQVGPNELWRNLGDGRFENITESSGAALADRISVTASFADVDNDGDADLYVSSVRDGNSLLLNDGSGHFADATESHGLAYSGHSSGAVFFDFDRDGWLDLYLCNIGQYTTDEEVVVRRDRTMHAPPGEHRYFAAIEGAFGGHLTPELAESSRMYHNVAGKRFEDVTVDVGLDSRGWTGDATPIDVNEDGWLDLYVLNMQGRDEYYENQAGARFVLKTDDTFGKTPWGAMGAKVFDVDNDGRLDLFLTDMHSDMSEDVGPEREKLKSRMQWPPAFLDSGDDCLYGNALYLKGDDGRFVEDSDARGAENYWPWGLSVGDLNADGREDAFLASSMCFPYRYAVNSVLLNDGARFYDSEFVLGVEPRAGGAFLQPWFELDASGADAAHPFCKGRSGPVLVWSALGTRSSVLLDLDDDGDLDIVTNEFNSRPQVLISNLNEMQPDLGFLKVRLTGRSSNRDGLGAVVRLVTSAGTQTRVHDGKSGYLSQSRLPLYFGLPDGATIERLEVDWPGSETQTVTEPVPPNGLVEIIQEGE